MTNPIKAVLSIIAVAALAGCAQHQPVYTTHYYATHKAAFKRELAACGKAEPLSGNKAKNCATVQALAQRQASENALKNALSGTLTTHAPSLAAYSLSGYGTPPKK